jgi:cell division protease FtsH
MDEYIQYSGDTTLACSDDTAAKIDAKVTELVQKQHNKAKQLLTDHRDDLDRIAQYLYEKETITGEEFMNILNETPAEAE